MIDRILYRADGRGYLEGGYDHLFVVPSEGGTPRQLTRGDFDHDGPPSWAPDGKALVISANRREDAELEPLDSEIYEVSFPEGELRQLTDRRGPDHSPVVSGDEVAFLGFDDRYQGYQATHLYILSRDSRSIWTAAGDLDRSVRRPAWSGDSMGVFFLYDDEGDTKIGYLNGNHDFFLEASQVGGASLGRPYASGSFSVSGAWECAYVRTDPSRPADVALGNRTGSRQLTFLNEDLLGHKKLGAVEEIWFESSHDERPIQGWIVTPGASRGSGSRKRLGSRRWPGR